MAYRIYIDESGTHEDKWLIIGMLFVPNHGALHVELCEVKEQHQYLNRHPSSKSKYRETHFKHFRNNLDAIVGKRWVDCFIKHNCFYRAIVIDWSIFDGKYFGSPFEADALKKKRAYKKWAELILQPELSTPGGAGVIVEAELYLDRLKISHGYDVVAGLAERFSQRLEGGLQAIKDFQHTDSAKDANQCLQLCDLLTGCLYQQLVPGKKAAKLEVRDYLGKVLAPFGVKSFGTEFWKGYSGTTLRNHFPKYSAWFWKPSEEGRERKERYKQRKKR